MGDFSPQKHIKNEFSMPFLTSSEACLIRQRLYNRHKHCIYTDRLEVTYLRDHQN